MDSSWRGHAISPAEALARLAAGNRRFAEEVPGHKDLGLDRRAELAARGQCPFAAIVSCSDARVPLEHLFDQGLGELFVIRVAGNVVDPVVAGSVEYAVEFLKTPLVVVMGHENCGAVRVAVDGEDVPGCLDHIVQRIRLSAAKVKTTGVAGDELYERTAVEHVRAMVAELRTNRVVSRRLASGRLMLVGAKYHLSDGTVTFFSGLGR